VGGNGANPHFTDEETESPLKVTQLSSRWLNLEQQHLSVVPTDQSSVVSLWTEGFNPILCVLGIILCHYSKLLLFVLIYKRRHVNRDLWH
jgi:hypothetical protein